VISQTVPQEFLRCLKLFLLNDDGTDFDETKCLLKDLRRVDQSANQLRNNVYTKDEFYKEYCNTPDKIKRWKRAQSLFHGAITNAIRSTFLWGKITNEEERPIVDSTQSCIATHITLMKTDKSKCSNIDSNKEDNSGVQDPHVDYRKVQATVCLKNINNFKDHNFRKKVRWIVFLPLTREGMFVLVFPEKKEEQENVFGKKIFIPYGFMLLCREDVVHTGGLMTFTQNKSGNARAHFYIVLEEKERKTRHSSQGTANQHYREANERVDSDGKP